MEICVLVILVGCVSVMILDEVFTHIREVKNVRKEVYCEIRAVIAEAREYAKENDRLYTAEQCCDLAEYWVEVANDEIKM